MNNLHDAAMEYHRLGWTVIPIRSGTKAPACRSWKPYQQSRPDEATLRRWFAGDKNNELAIVMGDVSGGLVVRDFDCMNAYDTWAAEYPKLVATLPTVETGRPGRHVYAKADIEQIRRQSKSAGTIIDLGDGELRGGGYCLAPPSKHPSGHDYRWLIPLGDEIPTIDLFEAGFLPCNREDREYREDRETIGGQRDHKTLVERGVDLLANPQQCPLESLDTLHSLLHDDIEKAIQRTLPKGGCQRHRQIFAYARELKALAGLADAPVSELKSYVRRWHQRALPNIRTKPFEESWFDFAEAWGKVKFPAGTEPIRLILAQAAQADVPQVAQQYEQPELRLLVSLCRELQRACGDGPFFLSTRTASGLLGIDDHVKASRWLRGLRHDGILRLVAEGSLKEHRASRYRYLGEL